MLCAGASSDAVWGKFIFHSEPKDSKGDDDRGVRRENDSFSSDLCYCLSALHKSVKLGFYATK